MFLPNGNVATFQGTTDAGDYTVLNRVLPDGAYPIELNGTVQSFISGGATGGRIWFYSPSGILIGSNAIFDVGSLLLTTADPGEGWTADGDNFSFASGAAAAGSKIVVANGAKINALKNDSYIALIAPRIEQGGDIEVNGSAAYIAAEQLKMTFSQGLFDVEVDVGTDDPNGIVHTGTTGGPANASNADTHRIYMAAVPKNQAMTMLLGGNIGFDAAGAGVDENGEIWLSSGWSPFHDGGGEGFQTFNTNSDAAMNITGGHFTSDVYGLANSDLNAETDDGDLTFDGGVSLEILQQIGHAFGFWPEYLVDRRRCFALRIRRCRRPEGKHSRQRRRQR